MRTIAQTALLMAILTLVSKCLGFIREMVMANYFGTSYVTDAYVMAITIPSIIFGGILMAVSTSYIPTYSRIVENYNFDKGNKFTSDIINLLLLLSIVSASIGLIFSNQIITIFASGFGGETAKLSSYFVRITFLYIIFSSMTGILEAYLQYKNNFLPPIITGYLLSGCTIIAIIVSAYTSHYYLAFGLLAGYIIRFILIFKIVGKYKYHYTFSIKFDENVMRIFTMAVPVFIGSSLLQINVFIDKTLASRLIEGSVSALNYANLLNTMIMGITISILTTIIYPKLTQAYSLKDYDRFNEIVGTGFNIIFLIAFPCSLGAMLFSNQIVQVVYERGAFNLNATSMTGSAFFYFSAGLLFFSLNDLLARAFYAMHDMKTPMSFAGITVIINIILNLVLVRFMAHNGLALSTSISGMCNTFLLYNGIKRKYPQIKIFKSINNLFKILISSIVAIAVSFVCYFIIINIINIRVIQLFIVIIIACTLYYFLLHLFKIEEIKFIKQLIIKR